jgi:methionine sulfoxide reductase heme-binding subunit
VAGTVSISSVERNSSLHLMWVAVAATVGYAITAALVSRVSTRMLPWVLGRGFGVGAYLALTALTVVGLWLRHPWRVNHPRPSAASAHRAHSLLATMVLLLVAGHVIALSVDRFAGVGWSGAFVPGRSGYRPLAVALGTISLYVGLAVGFTAALAGWVGGRTWYAVHRLALVAFALVWVHGVLAGSDERVLLPIYLVSGLAVAVLACTRRAAVLPESMVTRSDYSGGRR